MQHVSCEHVEATKQCGYFWSINEITGRILTSTTNVILYLWKRYPYKQHLCFFVSALPPPPPLSSSWQTQKTLLWESLMHSKQNRTHSKFASSYRWISSHISSSLESRCPAWISCASLRSFLRKQSTGAVDSAHDAFLSVRGVKRDTCVPVGLLRFFDQLLQFINPVGGQPPYDHVFHRLHHFTFLATLPPEANKCIIVIINALSLAETLNVNVK